MEEALQRIKELKGDRLDLSYLKLNELPSIPEGVTQLDCSYNYIKKVKNLPSTLQFLNCSYNLLSKISNLPENLVSLNCSYNRLSKLPKLPYSLTYLNISHNYFSKRPNAPDSIALIDTNNFYKTRPKTEGCFDFALDEEVDTEFYLLSSKNNIIVKIGPEIVCYDRGLLLHSIEQKGKSYVIFDPLFKGYKLTEKELNYIKNTDYSLYNFKDTGLVWYKVEDYVYKKI